MDALHPVQSRLSLHFPFHYGLKTACNADQNILPCKRMGAGTVKFRTNKRLSHTTPPILVLARKHN
jgi:hypothetical protein